MTATAPARSNFVTVVAWIFIALSGFATAISLLQNVMIYFMFPLDELRAAARSAPKDTPGFAVFMLGNIHLVFAGFFMLCAAMLASSIGLLRRKNWARLLFIGLLGLGIAWNLVAMFFPFLMAPPFPPDAPQSVRRQAEMMMTVMAAFSVVMGVSFSVLFAWIIKRLVSPAVRTEFQAET